MKPKISDLRKSNAELSHWTRQTANRLVRISTAGRDVETEGTTDKSDVIIHQKKLQKCLARVHDLREANEAAAASSAEVVAKLGQESSKAVPVGPQISPRIAELQRRIGFVCASNEQGEEERWRNGKFHYRG
jgi:hypothetical protein